MSLYFVKPVVDPLVVSWVGTAIAVCYAGYVTYSSAKRSALLSKANQINQDIKKGESKVVDTYEIEDLPAKTVLCRCWRSKCFPKCDGSHTKHNKETGDNIGPVIIQKRQ